MWFSTGRASMSSIDQLFLHYGPAYRWFATATAMVATISVVLSTTIVNVAIPDVMGAFGISQVQGQWLSTGFLAAMTATMLVTDWAYRAFGQRTSMIAALTIFSAGSVLGGIAPDESILTLARVIQGGAAGLVQPLAMTLLFQVFPTNQRGAAMGIFGVGVVLAPARPGANRQRAGPQQIPLAIGYLAESIALQANTLAFRDGFLVVMFVFLLALFPTYLPHRAHKTVDKRTA
jgi:MFS family permease